MRSEINRGNERVTERQVSGIHIEPPKARGTNVTPGLMRERHRAVPISATATLEFSNEQSTANSCERKFR